MSGILSCHLIFNNFLKQLKWKWLSLFAWRWYTVQVNLDNENLLIGGKSFFYKSWQDKGIFYIRDFMDSNGNFLNLHAFSQSTTINSNFLKYQGVIECLRKFMEKKDNEGNTKMNMIGPILPKAIKSILKQKKGSQNIYIVLNINIDAPSGKNRWNHIYNIDEKSWEYIFWPLLK